MHTLKQAQGKASVMLHAADGASDRKQAVFTVNLMFWNERTRYNPVPSGFAPLPVALIAPRMAGAAHAIAIRGIPVTWDPDDGGK
jgi:hypothetical protein